jgi:chromosome segregation ATPase
VRRGSTGGLTASPLSRRAGELAAEREACRARESELQSSQKQLGLLAVQLRDTQHALAASEQAHAEARAAAQEVSVQLQASPGAGPWESGRAVRARAVW